MERGIPSGAGSEGARSVDVVLAAVAAGDPRGQTAEELAAALRAPDTETLQQELEELVAQGLLERQGVGRGALYALAPGAGVADVADVAPQPDPVVTAGADGVTVQDDSAAGGAWSGDR